jgi:ADP-ribose pyrophosphatase YjhB (NUDIX family)
MYKVFINDRPIIFVSLQERLKLSSLSIEYQDLNGIELIQLVSESLNKKCNYDMVVIRSTDLEESFNSFKSLFKIVEAAGGLVSSGKNKLLWIHRLGKWDLPKGKIEEGESKEIAAVREVEEECGITDIELKQYLCTTYHMYQQNGKQILKPTYWYQMKVEGEPELTPQLEEDILECCWFSEQDMNTTALTNTYSAIKEVCGALFRGC